MTSKSRRHHRSRAATRVEEQILELEIDSPAHGGACVARDEDGRVVFVRHALPGERVRARVTSSQKSLAWADAVEILTASPDRVESVWPQAGPGLTAREVSAAENSPMSLPMLNGLGRKRSSKTSYEGSAGRIVRPPSKNWAGFRFKRRPATSAEISRGVERGSNS